MENYIFLHSIDVDLQGKPNDPSIELNHALARMFFDVVRGYGCRLSWWFNQGTTHAPGTPDEWHLDMGKLCDDR